MRLFLHYSFDDTKEIIDDYAEWFESEKSTGKSEAAVCHRLNISNIIHQNVDFTRDTGKQKIAFPVFKPLSTIHLIFIPSACSKFSYLNDLQPKWAEFWHFCPDCKRSLFYNRKPYYQTF